MSVCYYLGCKSGVGSNSGKWFGMATILGHDQYGNPEIKKAWFSSREQFELSVSDLPVGCPVILKTDFDTGKVCGISLDESYDVLEISPDFFRRDS